MEKDILRKFLVAVGEKLAPETFLIPVGEKSALEKCLDSLSKSVTTWIFGKLCDSRDGVGVPPWA